MASCNEIRRSMSSNVLYNANQNAYKPRQGIHMINTYVYIYIYIYIRLQHEQRAAWRSAGRTRRLGPAPIAASDSSACAREWGSRVRDEEGRQTRPRPLLPEPLFIPLRRAGGGGWLRTDD